MAMPAPITLTPTLPVQLTTAQFQILADVPPELEWFANLTNANTRRAYQQDIHDFMAFAGIHQPEQFREITRAHIIATRQQLVTQELANDTIRRKLAALSSLYAYLCERHAVLHNPVLGVKRPRSMNREGVTPALGDHQARMLLQAPPAETLKGKRDRGFFSTISGNNDPEMLAKCFVESKYNHESYAACAPMMDKAPSVSWLSRSKHACAAFSKASREAKRSP
jgi:hypothetical protein